MYTNYVSNIEYIVSIIDTWKHGETTSQNIVFGVTYYLELHNAMSIYCIFFPKNYQIGCLDTIEH